MSAKLESQPQSIAPKQRVQAVDALRGLALLGMLLVHFQYYVHDDGLWSQRVNGAIDFFAVNRFYPLFALLFGVGFTLQFTRWGERPGFVAMYLRRVTALMLFAVVLAALTGYRVLESYAFWALPLLAIRRWSNRALVVVVLLCAFSRPLAEFAVWQWERNYITTEQSDANVKSERRLRADFHREEDRLRDQGKFTQLALHRLRHSLDTFLSWRFYIPSDPFVLLVLGMLAVRFQLFQEPTRNRRLLIALIVYGVIAGIGSQFVGKFFPFESSNLRLTQAYRFLMFAIFDERFQGIAYAATLLLLTARAANSHTILSMLAAPGRLSLTNYVAQVTILEVVFASSAPLISLNRWEALIGVIVIFTAQVWFSRWWMSRFRYGPLEWLWRSFTFSRWEPLRRNQAGSAATA